MIISYIVDSEFKEPVTATLPTEETSD